MLSFQTLPNNNIIFYVFSDKVNFIYLYYRCCVKSYFNQICLFLNVAYIYMYVFITNFQK